MNTDQIRQGFHEHGRATIWLGDSPDHGIGQVRRARSRLRGVATRLGAKITTRAIEGIRKQGVTAVTGTIVHGPVDSRGCYLCRVKAERMARRMWLYTFDRPEVDCSGTLHRIVNDDPDRFETEVVAVRLADAGRACWLTLQKDAA